MLKRYYQRALPFAFLFLTCGWLDAANVILLWDASPTPGVTNYVLYAHTNAFDAITFTNAAVKQAVGTNLTVTLENIQPARWWFAVTAQKDGLESDPSNILPAEVPAPPAQLRTLAVQYGATLTNFTDVGFFRLRIQ